MVWLSLKGHTMSTTPNITYRTHSESEVAVLSLPRRTNTPNPREERFKEWLSEFRDFLRGKRGRCSTLARYLFTRRQNVHRWFIECHSQMPAWAAVHANVWFQSVRLVRDDACPP